MSSPVGCALSQPLMACEGVALTVRPATATEGVRGRDAHRLVHVVVAVRLRPATATEGVRGRDAHRLVYVAVVVRLRPATATEGVRGRDARRPAHVVVGRSLALLSLYCAVPNGAGRSFGAGGASRTARATPCEGRGRPGYGGGAVVLASGTAARVSEVAAGPEMGTAFGGAVGAESAVVASMGICKERTAR